MKNLFALLSIFLIFLFASCQKSKDKLAIQKTESQLSEMVVELPPTEKNENINQFELIGGWLLSEKWFGYLTVTLKFVDKENFNYWFSSDVKSGDEPKYPIKGKYMVGGNRILLITTESLYSNEWFLFFDKEEIVLAPKAQWEEYLKQEKVDGSRFLYKDISFTHKNAFSNHFSKETTKMFIELFDSLKKKK